jgi:hypothetical protein
MRAAQGLEKRRNRPRLGQRTAFGLVALQLGKFDVEVTHLSVGVLP